MAVKGWGYWRFDRDYAAIQDWMLSNAFARSLLITMLLFVNHTTTVLPIDENKLAQQIEEAR